jgi:hypothetical protein
LDLGNITLVARWVGFGLIILTWIQFIPLIFGWVGFGMAALSFILEEIYKKNLASSRTDDSPGGRPNN